MVLYIYSISEIYWIFIYYEIYMILGIKVKLKFNVLIYWLMK